MIKKQFFDDWNTGEQFVHRRIRDLASSITK